MDADYADADGRVMRGRRQVVQALAEHKTRHELINLQFSGRRVALSIRDRDANISADAPRLVLALRSRSMDCGCCTRSHANPLQPLIV